MHVLFVEPRFPANQPEFVRGLHAAGARVTGIGEAPVEELGPVLQSWLHGYERVSNVCHEGEMLDAVRRVQGREWVDRIEATIEAHILPVLVDATVELMSEGHPDLAARRDFIVDMVDREEHLFRRTLESGSTLLDQQLAGLQPGAELPGAAAFRPSARSMTKSRSCNVTIAARMALIRSANSKVRDWMLRA